ncbi:SAM-dependent methyltransferase [Klebsiella pneumoniae]|nr:SAM-dependent methyltransferase [Klebsiella pneumoniae]
MRQPARKGGDSLALSIVRSTWAHTEVRCHFPMSADSAEEAVWNDVAAALAEVAAGRRVGFITLGDAMLFSTGLSAAADWLPGWLEIVHGVTSFAAIAARAKTPLAVVAVAAVISCTAPEADIARRCASMTVWC